MSVRCRIPRFEKDSNVYHVAFTIDYKQKYIMMKTDTPDVGNVYVSCQNAWDTLQPQVESWKQQVDSGDYIIESTFTPQEDGSLVFT